MNQLSSLKSSQFPILPRAWGPWLLIGLIATITVTHVGSTIFAQKDDPQSISSYANDYELQITEDGENIRIPSANLENETEIEAMIMAVDSGGNHDTLDQDVETSDSNNDAYITVPFIVFIILIVTCFGPERYTRYHRR
jgi:hypothetical protein